MSDEQETFLLFEPEPESGISPKRILGLAKAIRMAGAEARVLPNRFYYPYAQDLFVLIGFCAFYPSVFGDMEEKRRQFMEVLEPYGFYFVDLKKLPSQWFDGGNVIVDDARQRFLMGMNREVADSCLEDDIRWAVALMESASDYKARLVEITHLHDDCCMGLLPNGKLLVKLDELLPEPFNSCGMGVTSKGLQQLRRSYPREDIITFSFGPHPDADYVLGMHDRKVMKSLSMLTNFTAVNGAVIGEKFPEPLAGDLKKQGIRLISPEDVGLETFVAEGDGFTGGSRCAALKVAPRGSTRMPLCHLRSGFSGCHF